MNSRVKEFSIRSLLRFASVALLLCACVASAQDFDASGWLLVHNHADVVALLTKYHEVGQYDYEIRQVATAGMDYIQKRVHEAKKDEKLAAVFDIDETALSNWDSMSKCGFCDYKTQAMYYPSTNDPAILPVLELYRLAQKLGVKTYFITGRHEKERNDTVQNLKSAGYDGWEQVVMKPDNMTGPARIFKSGKRQEIVDKGYTIILNIGDQASDLAGCCAERSFKLPNPFYLVP
jgi:acid phosphatase